MSIKNGRPHIKSGEPRSELTPPLYYGGKGLSFKKKRYRAVFKILQKREKEARNDGIDED